MRRFANGRHIPEWHYWARLGSVYSAARQFDQLIAAGERAAELAPENSTVLIDLADSLLRYRGDTVRARLVLKQAKSHAISDLAACFLTMVEGKLALEEGDAPEAVRRFAQSQTQFGAHRFATPLVGAPTDSLRRVREDFLRQFPVIELDEAVAREAITLRQEYKLKLPDAILWASARLSNALLVTRNTSDFDRRDPSIRIPYRL